jgi:hypothetical protein
MLPILTSRGVCWSKSMNDEAIAKFGQSLRGALIGRSHPEYEEARKSISGPCSSPDAPTWQMSSWR